MFRLLHDNILHPIHPSINVLFSPFGLFNCMDCQSKTNESMNQFRPKRINFTFDSKTKSCSHLFLSMIDRWVSYTGVPPPRLNLNFSHVTHPLKLKKDGRAAQVPSFFTPYANQTLKQTNKDERRSPPQIRQAAAYWRVRSLVCECVVLHKEGLTHPRLSNPSSLSPPPPPTGHVLRSINSFPASSVQLTVHLWPWLPGVPGLAKHTHLWGSLGLTRMPELRFSLSDWHLSKDLWDHFKAFNTLEAGGVVADNLVTFTKKIK